LCYFRREEPITEIRGKKNGVHAFGYNSAESEKGAVCSLLLSLMLHFVSEINSLYLFVDLILVPVPPFPTHPFLHSSLLSF